MSAIRIELTGPPRGKGRPRFSRAQGVAFTDGKTRTYEAALRYTAQEVMAGRAPIDGPLSVVLEAWMPIAASWSKRKKAEAISGVLRPTGRPDADNLIKTTDALNGVVWRDDAQIVDLRILKQYSDRPRLVLVVEPLQPTTEIDRQRERLRAAREAQVAA